VSIQSSRREKVISRVRKLLAMVSGNATENEVAIANEQAQKLIEKYRLEEAELTGIGEAEYQKFTLVEEDRTEIAGWKVYLAAVLADHNGCHVLARKGEAEGVAARITVVGREENVQTVKYMFQTIAPTIERLCEEGRKLSQDFGELEGAEAFNAKLASTLLRRLMVHGSARDRGEDWAKAFRNGVVDRIDTRLRAAKAEAREEAQASDKALAIVDSEVNRVLDYIQEHVQLGDEVEVDNNVERMDGYRAGLKAGDEIDLGIKHRQLKKATPQLSETRQNLETALKLMEPNDK